MTKLLKEMKSLLKIKLGEQGCRLSHHTKISKLLTDISKKKKGMERVISLPLMMKLNI